MQSFEIIKKIIFKIIKSFRVVIKNHFYAKNESTPMNIFSQNMQSTA